jgi:ferredoxin
MTKLFCTVAAALSLNALNTNAFLNSPLRKTTTSTSGNSSIQLKLKSTTSNTEQTQDLFYAAAGKPTVDMNKYNIPMDQILQEWTALLTAQSSMQAEGIYLNVKNSKELFADTLQYKVKRDGGLGLILTELAGGREDGVGITIIEEIVKGGNSENVGILPGDSIVAVSVSQGGNVVGETDGGAMETNEQRVSASTECLAYDSTIDVLTSLPPPSSPDEVLDIRVKRIRRKPKVAVKLQYPPEENLPDTTIELFSGENLRRAMLTRGIKLNDALSRRFDSGGTGDCGADGTCATCVIGVAKGEELLSPMKQQEEQILANKPRWRMACKAVVGYGMAEGEMTLQVNPKRW